MANKGDIYRVLNTVWDSLYRDGFPDDKILAAVRKILDAQDGASCGISTDALEIWRVGKCPAKELKPLWESLKEGIDEEIGGAYMIGDDLDKILAFAPDEWLPKNIREWKQRAGKRAEKCEHCNGSGVIWRDAK